MKYALICLFLVGCSMPMQYHINSDGNWVDALGRVYLDDPRKPYCRDLKEHIINGKAVTCRIK